MTKSFAKLSSWLSAFAVLLCTAALAGDLKFTYEIVQPCVPGVTGYSQAVIDLYVTTGSEYGLGAATMTVEPVDGVTIDPTAVVWDSTTITIVPGTNDPVAKTLSSGKLQLQVKVPAINTPCVQASASPQRLCTIYCDVDSSLAGKTISLPFGITTATGYSSTGSITLKNWLSTDSITSVDFNVYKSFNFFLAQGATFETDEDTALTIEATDTTKFEASAWDTATSTLQPTTDVEFVSAKFSGTNTVIDGQLVFIPDYPGSVEVQNGQIVFTPEANWNGEVWVNAVAHSTTIADTDTKVYFPITVNPVRDPLVISDVVSTLGGKEGETLGGTITFNVTDVDGGNYIKEASLFVVELGGSVISGTVTRGDTVDNVTPHTFTPNAVTIPYTTVIHPDNRIESCGWGLDLTDSRDADAVVSYTLLGVGGPIEDTDQPVEITSFTVNGQSSALAVKADASLDAVVEASDADEEDEVETKTQWSTDGTTWGDAQPALVKGTPLYAKGVATSNGNTVESAQVTITVENSAPAVLVDNGSIFVLRHEGGATPVPGTATFTATDADGLDDLRVTATDLRAAEPASDTSCTVTGTYGVMEVEVDNGTITATYTVNDATVTADEDTEETLTFYVTDEEEEDCIPVTVKCTFQANPPPVLTAATTTVTVAEVDAEGNPTAFEVTVSATDTNVYPAGVSAWAITVPDGWNAEAGEQTTGSVDEGTWEGSATWNITTAGHDTLDGSPRVTSADFDFTVAAVDVATGAEGTLDFTATITDVDRLPSAPTAVALEPAEPVHGDAIVAAPAGATDEDGDEITGYTYAWAYSADGESFTDLAETTDTLNDAEAIKKGYTVKVTAFAVTKPYGDGDAEAVSEEGFEATVVVGNTAPYMSTLGDQEAADADTNLEYTWTVDENSEDNPEEYSMTAAATDVDANDGVDSLTYAVSEIAENVGTLAIDPATDAITFTPAADYNTVEPGDVVTFTVTATDADGAAAANTATVTLVINEVNSAPTLTIPDQYVLPADMGVEQSVTATVEMGLNEDNQSISEASIEVLSGAEIFSVAPAVTFNGKDVTVTYTVAVDAELTAPAELKVTIKDDGTTAGVADPQSAEATFKVFLGGSPWYPSISFNCVDPDAHAEGHTVVIDGSDGSSYSITLKGATYEVLPADYVAIGHPGYKPNTELDATVYVWTQKGGTSAELCAEVETTVADYDEPGEATASADPEIGENGWVTLPDVSVPLAQSYTVTVTDENGKTTQTIGPVDFEPNDEGMILPTIQGLKIQLPDAGNYIISVTGKNPAGTGETTDLFEVVIEEDSEAELVWSDGNFTPENGAVLTSESVKFSWPVASGAKSYTLTVYNADGTRAATKSGVSGTSQTLTLKMVDGAATPYTWNVTATNGKKSIVSNDFSLTLCESTDSVIITAVAVGADGLEIGYEGILSDGIEISFDYQFFDVSQMKWSNGTVKAILGAGNTMEADLGSVEVEAEDYVVLQLKVNGKKQGDWVIYQVQDSL